MEVVCSEEGIRTMGLKKELLIEGMLKAIEEFEYLKVDEIPDIPLYMDQVTTLMEERLKTTSRNPQEDKVLTKTMINNYAKNHLLPSPEKKKYSREHILILIFIYYFKGVLSISDIQNLLKPLTEQFFGEKGSIELSKIYEEILNVQKAQVEDMKADIERKVNQASEMFTQLEGVTEEQEEFLQLFSFVSVMGYDVYFKKLMIERIMDEFFKEE